MHGLPAVPAVHVLTPENFSDDSHIQITPEPITSLPLTIEKNDPRLFPTRQETVESKPLPISCTPSHSNETVSEFISKVEHMIPQDRTQVEKITRGQSSNSEWYNQRAGCVTSTAMNRIHRFTTKGAKISPAVLVKNCRPTCKNVTSVPKMPGKESLKWGRAKEAVAIELYSKAMSEHHQNFRVVTSGLVVHPKVAYVRASPDGIAMCDCCPRRLVEVKCPYKARDITVKEAIKQKVIKFLEMGTDKYQLKDTTSEGYLSQVQCAMAVTETKACDFIVYNGGKAHDLVVVPVDFDSAMWEDLLKSAKIFFETHLAPAIMGHSPESSVTISTTEDDISESDQESDCLPPQIKTEVDSEVVRQSEPDFHQSEPDIHQSEQESMDCPTYCHKCKRLLPEEAYISDDHSNASVCCDHCDNWYCWPCARYTSEMEDMEYYCPPCVRSGEIVY